MILLNDYITIIVLDLLTRISSCDTVLKTFDHFLTICEGLNLHSVDIISAFAAIHLTDDKFLRYVNHSTCQVTRVGCTKSCI